MNNSDHWHDLVALTELEPGDVTPVQFQDREFAVYDGKDGISVTSARCTHGAANLADGYFDGQRIECPLHQGLFDCRTGKALAPPATRALKVYPSRTKGEFVQIRLVPFDKTNKPMASTTQAPVAQQDRAPDS